MLCGGTATLFFEYFVPQNHIYIFGAGHIGKALCYHLKNLDYFVTVIDDRKDVLDQLENAGEKILESFDQALSSHQVAGNAYFVIATYQHKYDGVVLNRIFQTGWNPRYVGMVASRKKQKILLDELLKKVPDADLSRCFIPVGIDIGGGSPDEIALSIIAEIQMIRYEKSGGHLRG
jgi:xanthine dehydrogenase accessory factor